MSQMAKPSMFAALQQAAPAPAPIAPFNESTAQGITYLGFVHPKSKNYGDIIQKLGTVPEGTPYLCSGGTYTRLDQPKLHYYNGGRFWVKRDAQSNAVAARATEPEGAERREFKDTVEAIVLVHVNGTVIPAVTSLRGPKAELGVVADKELKASQTPDWVQKGKDYAVAAQIPLPYARFTVTGRTYTDMIKYGPAAGSKFTGLKASVSPITPGEADTLIKASQTPEFKKLLASATETLESRIKQLKSLTK